MFIPVLLEKLDKCLKEQKYCLSIFRELFADSQVTSFSLAGNKEQYERIQIFKPLHLYHDEVNSRMNVNLGQDVEDERRYLEADIQRVKM